MEFKYHPNSVQKISLISQMDITDANKENLIIEDHLCCSISQDLFINRVACQMIEANAVKEKTINYLMKPTTIHIKEINTDVERKFFRKMASQWEKITKDKLDYLTSPDLICIAKDTAQMSESIYFELEKNIKKLNQEKKDHFWRI